MSKTLELRARDADALMVSAPNQLVLTFIYLTPYYTDMGSNYMIGTGV